MGYSLVWGLPPPPSETFAASPGGVALAVKHPYSVRLMFPALLKRWYDLSRLLVARIAYAQWECVCITIYGFPRSHISYPDNEGLIVDVYTFAQGLRTPVIIGGDLNVSIRSSPALSAHMTYKLWKITGDESPTVSKHGDG